MSFSTKHANGFNLVLLIIMNIDSIRAHCLSLPHATENIQWGDDLCFKVGGKLFAVLNLESSPTTLGFKCNDEKFAELIEVEGIIPAPYLARAKWVLLQSPDVLPDNEIKDLLTESYRLVFAKFPKKVQQRLASSPSRKATKSRRRTATRKS
jgi:predicted DNA-binding protein (MmcQ/YjbR family)